MSKWANIIIGSLEIVAGVVLDIFTLGTLGNYLIAAGIGTVLSGIGTLMSKGPLSGTATLSRNPVAPWNVVYGRQKVGGILVHISEFDENNKYLDLVIVLACHASEGNVVLLFDGQRVRLDGNGCSFEPTQQTISIVSVTRANGVVTVELSSAITDLETGDTLVMKNISDATYNGKYAVTVIDPTHFSYICGGTAGTVSGSGEAMTVWPNYKAKVHMEVLLGDHTDTFPGMINGTPYDGDPSNLVTYPNNPWTADHKLLGKTSVFLRLHYNDEIFANGLPTIAFRLSGKKDIYDPRTSPASYGYSENPALIIADYLAHPVFGFKAAYGTEIPIDRLISAANICDEAVALASGGTEPRYTCNGGFPLTLKRGEVLQNLLTSCGGRLTYTQGQFVIHPAAWPGSSLPPQPPFAPLNGQAVAWAYPGSNVGSTNTSPDAVVTIDSTDPSSPVYPFSPSRIEAKTSYVFNSGGHVTYSEFIMPSLPADAKITGMYPVAILTALGFGAAGGPGPGCPGATLISAGGFDVDASSGGFTGQYDLPSIGTSEAALSGQSFEFSVDATSGNYFEDGHLHCAGGTLFSYAINSLLAVQFMGIAIYYTSASAHSINPSTDISPVGPISAGPFRWREKVSIRDLYNGVKGTYISPANNWQSSDIPPYAQDTDHGYVSTASPAIPFDDANLAADGGERRWLDIQLPFTISVATAQRLCKIELMRRRQQGTGTFSYNMAMYKATALDIVQMTLPLLGWVNKYLEIAAHRFTINKQQIDGNEVTLLGTEIDVQETDPSVYDWSTAEELTAQGFQQPNLPGSIDGGGSTLVNNSNYQNTPAIALSQPDSTHIALAAVSVAFASGTVTYNARSIVIPTPSAPTWYYVTIHDPDYLGDQSPELAVFAETTTAKVGVADYTYMGAILALPAGGAVSMLAGGWPAPQTVQVGV